MERVEIYDHCRVWAGRLPWLSFEFRASTVGTFLVYLFYNPTSIALNFRNVRVELSRTFLSFYQVFPWWNKDVIGTYYPLQIVTQCSCRVYWLQIVSFLSLICTSDILWFLSIFGEVRLVTYFSLIWLSSLRWCWEILNFQRDLHLPNKRLVEVTEMLWIDIILVVKYRRTTF